MSNLRVHPRGLRPISPANMPQVEAELRPHRHLIWEQLEAEIASLRRMLADLVAGERVSEWDIIVSTDREFLVTYVAGTALSGHRVVVIHPDNKAYYADHDIMDDVPRVMGITTQAASENNPIGILVFGEMIEPSWNWQEGKAIFLGSNGVLTQTPPTTGFLMEVAFAVTPQKIMVEIKPAIVLA
jgi:hypothetical protein